MFENIGLHELNFFLLKINDSFDIKLSYSFMFFMRINSLVVYKSK
jgi:hypothetical protein